jgi:hypothetical protein
VSGVMTDLEPRPFADFSAGVMPDDITSHDSEADTWHDGNGQGFACSALFDGTEDIQFAVEIDIRYLLRVTGIQHRPARGFEWAGGVNHTSSAAKDLAQGQRCVEGCLRSGHAELARGSVQFAAVGACDDHLVAALEGRASDQASGFSISAINHD